jgi:hypothetical protein
MGFAEQLEAVGGILFHRDRKLEVDLPAHDLTAPDEARATDPLGMAEDRAIGGDQVAVPDDQAKVLRGTRTAEDISLELDEELALAVLSRGEADHAEPSVAPGQLGGIHSGSCSVRVCCFLRNPILSSNG